MLEACGSVDGRLDGNDVGTVLGDSLGAPDGSRETEIEGMEEPVAVGKLLGLDESSSEGSKDALGRKVGVCVG